VLIHPSIAVGAIIVIISFFLSSVKVQNIITKNDTKLRRIIVVAALITLPIVTKNVAVEKFFFSKDELWAFSYLAKTRIPYHVLPETFMNPQNFVRSFIIIAVLILLVLDYSSKAHCTRFFVFTMLLTLYVSLAAYFIDKPVINLSMPWRIIGGIYPICAIYLIYRITSTISYFCKYSRRIKSAILIGSFFGILWAANMSKFAVISLGIISLTIDLESDLKFLKRINSYRKIITIMIIVAVSLFALEKQISTLRVWKNDSSNFPGGELPSGLKNQGIGLVPPQFNNFRVDYGLSIFVNDQSVPFNGKLLAIWVKRLKIAERAQLEPNTLCTAPELSHISWAILPNEGRIPVCYKNELRISQGWILVTR